MRSIINRTFSDPFMILRMVGMTGFEPAASWSQTKHSTKLSYIPIMMFLLEDSFFIIA